MQADPAEQPVGSQWLLKVLRGIEHHFNHPLDIAVCGHCSGNLHPEPPGDRGAHPVGFEDLAFDFAGLQNVEGQRL